MAIILRLAIFNLLLILSNYSLAQRQSGGLECAITRGAFRVHFTAYQAPQGLQGSNYLERYCEQIPLPGEIFMTLDIYKTYGGEIVRDKPVAVRVVEGAPSAEANPTLLELPTKIYRSGIVELHPKLPAPGDYHLVVVIGDNPEDTVTIPVRVGTNSGFLNMGSTTRRMLLLMLVVVGILTAYSFYSGRKGQSKEKKS